MNELEQAEIRNHLKALELEKYHQEQVEIAIERVKDFENGLEEAIPHEEAMRILRQS